MLGFSRMQQIRYVILPHVARVLFPPLSNQYILMTLGTSMAAIFGVEELTGRAFNIKARRSARSRCSRSRRSIYVVDHARRHGAARPASGARLPRQDETGLMLDAASSRAAAVLRLLQRRVPGARRALATLRFRASAASLGFALGLRARGDAADAGWRLAPLRWLADRSSPSSSGAFRSWSR